MALAPSKKKKIIRILIILGGRLVAFYDGLCPDASVSESTLDQVASAKHIFWDFPDDEETWTKPQEDAWAAAENMADELETGNPTEAELETLSGILGDALANL